MIAVQNLLTETKITTDSLNATHIELSGDVPCRKAVAFCHALSEVILSTPLAQTFPSLQALGFWLRPANLTKVIKQNLVTPEQAFHMPRGTVFQIPPRNVDVLFGYTTALSLLCGNNTIARLWEDRTEEQDCLIDLMRELVRRDHKEIGERLHLLAYGRDNATTTALSALCDARMVWGGDATVQSIREIPLPPLATEVSFADRFSAALINAKSFLNASQDKQTKLIQSFTNDMLSFDQMACTSPRLLYWHGTQKDTKAAMETFYPALCEYALEKYGAPDAGASVSRQNDEFLAFHDLDVAEKKYGNAALRILQLRCAKGLGAFKDVSFGNGMLLDLSIEDLSQLPALTAKKDQTLGHWGYKKNEIESLAKAHCGKGFERYIPIGQTLNFDPIWDGHNLFDTMTKLIKVQT